MSNDSRNALNKGKMPVYYASASEAEHALSKIEERLVRVEQSVRKMETERAVNVEKQKFIEGRFNQLDTRLDKIDGHVSRLVWLIIATIVGGFMSFILQGALSVV